MITIETVTLKIPVSLFSSLEKLANLDGVSVESLAVQYLEDRVKQEFAKNYKSN